MPTDDVSDLRDVVDAINRLCETMKSSDCDAGDDDDNNNNDVEVEVCENVEVQVKVESEADLVSPDRIVVSEVETYVAELWSDAASLHAAASAPEDDVSTVDVDSYLVRDDQVPAPLRSTEIEHVETTPLGAAPSREVESELFVSCETRVENVTVSQSSKFESVVFVASDPVVFEEPITASFEPASEMYYTASSEVSLLSDVEIPDRGQEEMNEETVARDDRNGVMAGHVAAMRERFESMTRANTPCPDVMRSVSPSLDVYRNITPSPDHLG